MIQWTPSILARFLAALAVVALCVWWGWSRVQRPFDLDYAVDLSGAAQGRLDVTLRATGRPPGTLRLALPTGLFLDAPGGVVVTPLAAWNFTLDGERGAPLPIRPQGRGWAVDGMAQGGALQYRVTLPPPDAANPDLRAHLSVRSGEGLRVAGFHLFLVPDDARIHALTVRFIGGPAAAPDRLATPWPAAGTPDGIVHTPTDLRDLGDALVAWGEPRLREQEVAGCAVRLAVRGDWAFPDTALERLVARIGAAEIAFFGTPPHPSMLLLVDANRLPAAAGFPYCGLHVGHSLLLLLDPSAGGNDLEDKAASLIAHEMFHGWLGEEIRQQGTEMNWFVEGATSWYAARLLVAADIWTTARAREVVGGRVDAHYVNSPLRGRLTLAAAARGLLRDGETTRFAYAGGALAAQQLDAWLAGRTGRAHPLDAVLRDLYARRAAGPLTRATLEGSVRRLCRVDCHGWLEAHVYGNEPLPPPATMF
ncbi:MAG: M1 family aminopeptidase [Candidatus Krumholzibacteriia bacterium]